MNQLEIDFLPVGEGEKSGDAIAMRFGSFDEGTQRVVIIDGGDKAAGEKLVELVKTHYQTDKVDLVISTHPDADHTSGLRIVLEELNVTSLWMHLPWEHSERIRDLFVDGRITDESLKERLRKAYRYAYELEGLAEQNGVTIYEPFAGHKAGNLFTVLSPSEDYYEELLTTSLKTPATKGMTGVFESIKTFSHKAINWISETLEQGTLDDSGETSSENNSSAIVLFEFDNYKFLFTGDAGIPSMERAIEYCNENNISLDDLNIIQVPHHGAQRNIGPTIIKSVNAELAIVSASQNAPKHPSYKVTNEFHRNGIPVFTTEGSFLNYRQNCDLREGLVAVSPLGFKPEVQE